jgi:hemoglobin
MISHELTEESLARFLDAFYAKVRRDPELAPVFADAIAEGAWPTHLGRIRDFWSSVLLKTERYKGNPFVPHLGKGIRPAHFTRWLHLFDETAVEMFEPKPAAVLSERAHRIGESLQFGLFFEARRTGRAASAPSRWDAEVSHRG